MRRLVLASFLAAAGSAAFAQKVERSETGIEVHPAHGPVVRLEVYGGGIIRVTEGSGSIPNLEPSLMVKAKPIANAFILDGERSSPIVRLNTGTSSAEVDVRSGRVSFRNRPGGRIVLSESRAPWFGAASAEGAAWLSISQQFNRGTDEGFYGLGQHQNGQMNYNGEDVVLAQHNMDVAIPFVLSTNGYGLLWDNNSVTRFGDPRPYAYAGGPGDGLKVNGGRGWTATYSAGGRAIAKRQEPTIQLQYLEDVNRWPAGTRTADMQQTIPGLHVTFEGTIVPRSGGLHRFRLYGSGYFKLFVDGRKVLDRWRQNWNPWYHNFDQQLTAGRPHKVRIEWDPDSGYMALLHDDPRSGPDRRSLTLSSDFARAVDYYFIPGSSMDEAIAGYRGLTGKAPILPKWAYGFWQSRQRYETQDQLLGVVHEYRRLGIPLDNIVQDWLYWP
ncbi:MAG TPA: TIM-barrel domain-containing protein, partial [Sphingomicrobium sp.]|nr:TIM-barrel domain-containing protein [Sphingomicrobium sp.]